MKLKFDRDMTTVIKGIAIIIMILHHCGIPSFWNTPLVELNSRVIVSLMSTCKICVGIFTFMVGYGYAFAKDKNYQYSISHIIKLLIPFWVILFLFTIPVAYSGMDLKLFVLNMFGVNSTYNWFSWFVTFYIFAMIIMPLMSKYIDNKPVICGGGYLLRSSL